MGNQPVAVNMIPGYSSWAKTHPGGGLDDFRAWQKSQWPENQAQTTGQPAPYAVPGGGTASVGGQYGGSATHLPGTSGVSGGGGGGGNVQQPLGSMFDDYTSRAREIFDRTKDIEYDSNLLPNLTAGEFRGAGASERGQQEKRALIGSGINPNSISFGREMDRVGREREANIYDSIAKSDMGKSAFELDKSGALGDLLKGDVNFANVMSDYLTKSSGLSLDNIWNSINRGDYLTLLQDMFGMPPGG